MLIVFDIDGVLTPPRQRMNYRMADLLARLNRRFVLVTGSDYDKVVDQVPFSIRFLAMAIFACNGAEMRINDQIIHRYTHKFPPALVDDIEQLISLSSYKVRTGRHVEFRGPMVNFSVVGRNATFEQRKSYRQWDELMQERKRLCESLKSIWPTYDFAIGGEISIDVSPVGWDKSMILEQTAEPIIFFGDKTEQGGNDYPLACRSDRVIAVKSWQETANILSREFCPTPEASSGK